MKPIAIITGSSTGLGRSLAIQLSSQYFIYLISRNKNKLIQTKKIIDNKNNECDIIVADVSKKESVDIINKSIKNKNDIALLINNAGIGVFKNISETSINDWDNTLNTNLRGSFLMTKLIIDNFKSKKSGKIVFVSSIAGLQPFSNSTAYVSSKYGLRGFASALREEVRDFNVKVMTVFPGAIDTPIWDNKNMGKFRSDMMNVDDVSSSIIHAINAPNNCVIEEITIRRVAGDF